MIRIFISGWRAYDNDSDKAAESLNKCFKLNPNHIASLLFQADNLIDREAARAGEGIARQSSGDQSA